MDIEATYAELKALQNEEHNRPAMGEKAEERLDRVMELWEAMDEWLTKGGFAPEAWKLHRAPF